MEIQVGTKVRLISTGEVGIVVHTWINVELDAQDNYVAFFGDTFPVGETKEKPYILRYLSCSLEVID